MTSRAGQGRVGKGKDGKAQSLPSTLEITL